MQPKITQLFYNTREWLTLALCRRFRALCGRKQLELPPKRLGRAIMSKLLCAGAVSTNALLAPLCVQPLCDVCVQDILVY
jgi:hypothetical protein